MAAPNYSNIFSGSTPAAKPSLAGGWATKLKELKEAFPEGINENMFIPLLMMQQQENVERMNDPANITRQFEAMEGPLGRMARDAASLQAQKDTRSLVGGLISRFPDTLTQALGAKFAYDQPVFNAISGTYNPNPYAYGVLNRRGGAA